MKRHYAIIGLGSFGIAMLERLAEVADQIVIIDKQKAIIEKYKDLATKAYIVDAVDHLALERLIPEGLDVAIVDMGDNIEAAILAVNLLKKQGVREIIARTNSEARAEILSIVGATRVINPSEEAAGKLVPVLVSSTLLSFIPVSASLVLAEVKVPAQYQGRSIMEADLRRRYNLNVVAIRNEGDDDYSYFQPDRQLQSADVLLCAGSLPDINAFAGGGLSRGGGKVGDFFNTLFRGVGRAKQKPGSRPVLLSDEIAIAAAAPGTVSPAGKKGKTRKSE
ncbi:MAG: hypothetical protein A2087_02385 [Spirochaetes bacterium GWD1_61_31]|nr:MAG: hypothetical protein A2Y37_00805 [Spirochaetes bacterium GWB1_60_80]OHD34563.1 MAG: hypothetical protein A2004_11715 [Spirochaetes bacterium GWC1_61_12]OHD44014.1 MAG: hypothetical protein A2087_02385 [Spirochaetes bacterium GWD1_61_31]OHD46174.1 MAG: hypothetical protein A2Y35_00720 [Spirochaetes bacterium GWE1_60_18]OHD60712.1 MAG: hypothetical protein A2Y32_07525 [Spirochaetes bacterium GWF1_60_12]HAP43900.1 TrkA family potassium uptake protein [Spirochaetaceae bacterium]